MENQNLIQNLQRTIRALESLSKKPLAEVEQVEELLDQLFQQKIDLVNLRVNPSSPLFQQANHAMSFAASQAEKSLRLPATTAESLPHIHHAIEKLGKLLNGSWI